MLCYRCGSHVPDNSESCGTCGQKLAGGGLRQATATFSRRKLQSGIAENAPYKPGDVLNDRYTIKDVVGAGPLGFVFRAHDKEIDVELALKVVNSRLVQTPEERKQFAKALKLGRKLSHQNLVRVYEEGEHQERPFYTMQFLEGLTLRKIIDLRIGKGQFFTMREVEPILGQIAAALDAAHKLGPHSDVRPENVIVLPDLLKLSDFGLGNGIPRLPFVQAQKQRKGDRYLAPEYVQGSEVDQRADLYSLGVIVGEMLCGLVPDGSIPELTQKNRDLPAQIEGLYRKALNANPVARPKTAGAFFEEFAELTKRVSPPPLKARPEPASAPRSRPPLPPAAAVAPPLELVPRTREPSKPPPPVPDELLSDEMMVSDSSVEELPPDATQPMDESAIPPPPPAIADDETELVASVRPPPPPPAPLFRSVAAAEPQYEPTQSTIRRSRALKYLMLVLLTISGLVIGAAGGYWIIERWRQPGAIALPDDKNGAVDEKRQQELQAKLDEARKQAEEKKRAELQADEDARRQADNKAADDRRAAELKAAEDKRLSDEKAAQEKKAADERRAAEEKRQAESKKERSPDVKLATAKVAGEGGCPDGMRRIPGGSFKIGTAKDDPMMGFDEKALKSVDVAAFCIDAYEYPDRRGALPAVNVSWNDAKRLCESKGKRLCSEEEWEKACKGPSNARYPYGANFDAAACNTEDETGEDRTIASSGKFGRCKSGYGVADLSGNVAEWTSSPYATGSDMTQKGGSFGRPDYAARCSARKQGSPSSRSSEVGFRCCADIP